MATSATLPFIQDPHGGNYSGQLPPGRGYPPDSRYASLPSGGNGYPSPGQYGHPVGYLPPMQSQSEHHSQGYPPSDHPGSYYDDRRRSQYGEYQSDSYYYRQQGPPPNSYPREYHGPAPGAPRQRTSIACEYCRKRKTRCSGYQSAPGGKCQNCARKNQECIFRPVSASNSTAFVPLSAVRGGIPPGTPLYGAYGQPLTPNSVPGSHHYPSSHQLGEPHSAGGFYGQPGQSRRQSPRGTPEDDQGSRSSAQSSSTSSPGGGIFPYPNGRHSPRAAAASTTGPQSRSPGTQTPIRPNGVPATYYQPAPNPKMSVSNLLEQGRY